SLFEVTHDAHGWEVQFRITTVSAVLIAMLWLPTLLRVIALTGGNLKTPAGEASTTGLLGYFPDLPPAVQAESLSAAAAVIDQTAVLGPEEQRPRARQVREGIEGAIADIPWPKEALDPRLEDLAGEYERTRRSMPSGPDRTTRMSQIAFQIR